MENIEYIKTEKTERLLNITKSHKALEKNISNLNIIATKLQNIADGILEQAANPSEPKPEHNKFKHDLNNSEHQLIQIVKFTEEMLASFNTESKELILLLRTLL